MTENGNELTVIEYQLLNGQLDDLPFEQANGLRARLAEKYYAYLDKLMQLKMAMREYQQVADEVNAALPLTETKI